jgi:signal transduction histidine kinase/PAS domain-containing protein
MNLTSEPTLAPINSGTESTGEVATLLKTLHATKQRLEELMRAELDVDVCRAAQAIRWQHGANTFPANEIKMPATVLDALPVNIALLDATGTIISVNESWRRFAAANQLAAANDGVGLNYLDICDQAQGDDMVAARQVASGIRAVLQGASPGFSFEYACHSPTEQRWFVLTVTPAAEDRSGAVVVMHRTITERKQTETQQRVEQERYLRQRNALINFTGGVPTGGEDLIGTMRRITETAAATLGIARASVWRYNEERSAIRCLDLYETATNRHSAGLELAAADFPAYFRALAERDVIVAADAQHHPSTCEFTESYLRPLGITSMLDAPIQLGGHAEGVLCHEHIGPLRHWTTDEETFAVAVANMASIALEGAERKRAQAELEDLHQQLVIASRQSGMAEIATNVLHNVGNVLNSVNVSTGLIVASVKQSKIARLGQVAALLREHAADLVGFLARDTKGKQLPDYLARLADHLLAEQAGLIGELESLQRNVDHIKEIVAMQQSYARFGGVKEIVDVVELLEDALRINESAISRQQVEVVREFEPTPPVNIEKHKVLQILVNLIRNAKHACQDAGRPDQRLTVRVAHEAGLIKISVADNGVGIAPENLTRIFGHGFTTRKDGHGFGLHSGALAAQEMDGTLTVHSAGPGHGACFTLTLPARATQDRHD